MNFYDITQYSIKDPPCSSCSSNCKLTCGNKETLGCVTDLNSAQEWLRLDETKNALYGETPLYTDFSQGTMKSTM
jgi:hypothetical protein